MTCISLVHAVLAAFLLATTCCSDHIAAELHASTASYIFVAATTTPSTSMFVNSAGYVAIAFTFLMLYASFYFVVVVVVVKMQIK